MEDELFKVKCKLLLDLEDIFILNIYLLNLGFSQCFRDSKLSGNWKWSKAWVFQKLPQKVELRKKDCSTHARNTYQQTHLHNHQIISPASETARFGARPYHSALRMGGFVPIRCDWPFPLAWFCLCSPAQAPTVRQAGAIAAAWAVPLAVFSGFFGLCSFRGPRKCSSNQWN